MNENEIVGGVKHLKKSGILWVVILGVVAGVILLIIGSRADDGDVLRISDREAVGDISLEQYEEKSREQVRMACQGIMKSGEVVSVTLYFERGYEAIYARDEQGYSGGQSRYEYVIIGSGTNAHALYLGENLPRVSGIGVVCTGESPEEVAEMINLLASIYGISHNRIYIV